MLLLLLKEWILCCLDKTEGNPDNHSHLAVGFCTQIDTCTSTEDSRLWDYTYQLPLLSCWQYTLSCRWPVMGISFVIHLYFGITVLCVCACTSGMDLVCKGQKAKHTYLETLDIHFLTSFLSVNLGSMKLFCLPYQSTSTSLEIKFSLSVCLL
jgi:hypothetical protein